jgi:RNA polymerase sigma factor (sigma-70 family)
MTASDITTHDIHGAIEGVWRIEAAKLIAGLTRITRDLGQAEELAQDALEAALRQWPSSGIPDKPAAWLMQAAKNRSIDGVRRRVMQREKHAEIGRELQSLEGEMPDWDAALDDHVGDDLLRLIFVACHPVLATEARVALTLRVVGGLTTDEIARAFLAPEPTIAQRIVRAKRTLAEKQIPFEVPRGEEMKDRLGSVLEVIYLIFNEGYAATAGADWTRPALCKEALRLGRILAELAPAESEVHGLVSLMEIQASRLQARIAKDGTPILLMDQNRAQWDQLLIRRGLAALQRAQRSAPTGTGPYALQAAIAACHARARKAEETDWGRIVAAYDVLLEVMPTPVVALNRAVAVSMAAGPAAGLELIDALADEPALKTYHLLRGVRGDLLFKLGRNDEARAEFEHAARLTRNARERDVLARRADACGRPGSLPDNPEQLVAGSIEGTMDMKSPATPKSESPAKLIDARIKELDDWRGKMLARLRALVKEADPEVVEEWKWRGVPVWEHDGIICTGETYKTVVKMTFAKGAALEDPAGLFNSSLEGNTRRAIDFPEDAKVNEKALKALIRAAVALNTAKTKAKAKPK